MAPLNFSALPLPRELRRLTSGYEAEPVTIGKSQASTYRLSKSGGASLFLKVEGRDAGELAQEQRVLEWLGHKLPVPEVHFFGESEDWVYLLTTGLDGKDACNCAYEPERLVPLLAEGLRPIHAVPIAGCPFNWSVQAMLGRAAKHVRQGAVDESDFESEHAGWTAVEVLAQVRKQIPPSEERILTHGDYCLPNVILSNGSVAGFVDVGRAGVSDRYRDLGIGLRSIRSNLGPGYEELFFKSYGLERPDWEKVEFFILLDELF